MNRSKIIVSTSIIKFVSQFLDIVLNFVVRKVLLSYIGVQYLGLNGVVADIISMLSITELGFQAAIIYRLYKPLSQNDQDAINSILSALKQIYRIIGLIIIGGGLCVLPFLKFLIKDDSLSMVTVITAYLIMLFSSGISYFISYKRTLLFADQKQLISASIDTWVNIFIGFVKIICVVTFRNYYLFVILTLIQTVLSNGLINLYCNKLYPNLNSNAKVSDSLRKDLYSDTKNIFAGKIAAYVYSSTDNLVISSIIGTGMVGITGNYTTLLNALTRLVLAVMSPFQPMIGDYLITADREKNKKLFQVYTFLRYTFTLLILAPAEVMVDRFISLFYGSDYIMPRIITILIVADYYISIVHGPTGEYITGSGLFKEEKHVLFLGAFANITISIIGAFIFGVPGVLAGTVVSQMIMWLGKARLAFKHSLNYDVKQILSYWITQVLYITVFIAVCLVSSNILDVLPLENTVTGFILAGVICVTIAFLAFLICFTRNDSFRFLAERVRNRLKK